MQNSYGCGVHNKLYTAAMFIRIIAIAYDLDHSYMYNIIAKSI